MTCGVYRLDFGRGSGGRGEGGGGGGSGGRGERSRFMIGIGLSIIGTSVQFGETTNFLRGELCDDFNKAKPNKANLINSSYFCYSSFCRHLIVIIGYRDCQDRCLYQEQANDPMDFNLENYKNLKGINYQNPLGRNISLHLYFLKTYFSTQSISIKSCKSSVDNLERHSVLLKCNQTHDLTNSALCCL